MPPTSPLNLSKFEQLKATGNLPSPKGAALEILRLTQKEETSVADLARAVKTDPAFVGRLIKAANSAQTGVHRPIVSIQDALILLGIPTVRSLALSFSLLSNHQGGNCKNFDYGKFWSRSLACAVAFQEITKQTRVTSPDEAFCVGLLGRVGELALATLFPDDYARLLAQWQDDGDGNLLELEQKAFVMTHSEMTAAMMLDWGLPKAFTDPVFYHERPQEADFVEGSRPYVLTWSMTLSEHIADICMAEDADRRARIPDLIMLGSKLSIDAETLMPLCDRVAREWWEWAALLNVESNTVPPFDELSKPAKPVPASPDGPALPEDSSRPMRILLVAQNRGLIDEMRQVLCDAGHEVFDASGDQQGFELAVERQPQIMVVESSATVTHLDLIRSLRQTQPGRNLYIFLLTEQNGDQPLIDALESGVDDFIMKPLKPRVLAARLVAAQRVIRLQEEVERDREEIRRFAAELAVTNRRLQEAALTDSLTGFPNRRYAMERIEQEWAAADRSKRPLACMVIDVDTFKGINDTHGHDVGDVVLKQVAAALKRGLRTQDVVARIGGDEFLVICPDTPLTAALICAERMRKSVEAIRCAVGTLEYKGSVSLGVAVREDGMANVDMLIKRADQAVYLAKQRGRNRVATLQAVK